MFYRRKIILSLIDLLGGEVEKLRFQKLLFLYAMRKQNPEYDFVPYKFGCYSYSANADMIAMIKKEQIAESDKLFLKIDQTEYFNTLKPLDQTLLSEIVEDYGSMSSSTLIKHTYLNFPFFATKSTIVHDVLPGALYDRVEKEIPKADTISLFTIGYEGVSLEKYLIKLVRNNVKLLVDVRRNPLSMKFGFSKTLLKRYCNSLDIEYIHIPEVGIASENRQQLNDQKDYDVLFKNYCKTTIKETTDAQKRILELLVKHRRIALTCFEAEPCQCHRSHLASAISNLPNFDYPLIHL
ncbi:MAG: DUF488 domain-containing protein [Flavobacteriales bacterium]|nr:MAG: DUF488 domain-containing protein [Flavobacteriales bacterium]